MHKITDKYLVRFLCYCLALYGLAFVVLALSTWSALLPFTWAYLLSMTFVGSNFFVVRNIDLENNTHFVRIFGLSLGVRFLLVIGAIVLGLLVIKNHQIFFTVSFIISYICHSIIEIIFLKNILEIDTG